MSRDEFIPDRMKDQCGEPDQSTVVATAALAGLTAIELLQRMTCGALVFLDGRNEHGSHVLMSLPQAMHVSNDTQVAIDEQAEEILTAAEDLGFQIGAHVWARFSWIREEYHHGYFEFAEIDEAVTRVFHAAFPGLDGFEPADGPLEGQDGHVSSPGMTPENEASK